MNSESFPRSNFRRRFAAWIYDALVVIAFAMLTTFIHLALVQLGLSTGLLQLGNAPDIAALIQTTPWLYALRSVMFVLVGMGFFVYFWRRGGQTIGMRAWRLKVRMQSGEPITLKAAWLRAATALLGLGSLVVILNRKKRLALQDMIAGTEVITLTKEENRRIYQER